MPKAYAGLRQKRECASEGMKAVAAIFTAVGLVSWMLAYPVLLPSTASAQEPAEAAPGILTTQALKDFSDSETITVTPYDDNALNLRLKTEIETVLEAQDRAVAEAKTGLLLLFETKVVPSDEVPRGPSLGSAQAGTAGVEVNVNVWSSTQDSVLGGRQERGDLGTNVLHINALLRDQASGDVLWQGDAYHTLESGDTERIALGMIPPLIEKLGESISDEPFEAP